MPQETCFMGCKSCIRYGGVWCPSGHVVVWINGVRWMCFKSSAAISSPGVRKWWENRKQGTPSVKGGITENIRQGARGFCNSPRTLRAPRPFRDEANSWVKKYFQQNLACSTESYGALVFLLADRISITQGYCCTLKLQVISCSERIINGRSHFNFFSTWFREAKNNIPRSQQRTNL